MKPTLYLNFEKINSKVITLAFLLYNCFVFGQSTKTNEAYVLFQKKDYLKAAKAIDEAAANPETENDPKTLCVKGFIYKDIYKTSEIENPESPARIKALDAVAKGISVDTKGEFTKNYKDLFWYLVKSMKKDAVAPFNSQEYAVALKLYQNYLEARKLMVTEIDTSVTFYCGYSAYQLKKDDIAINYLNKVVRFNYDDSYLYFMLADLYARKKDNQSRKKYLDEGLRLYPKDRNLAIASIQYFEETGNLKELENKLQSSIKNSPKDIDLLLKLALIFEKQVESEKDTVKKNKVFVKAIETYQKVLDIEPNHANANYNMGIMIYNLAVDKITQLEFTIDFTEIDKIQEDCKVLFKRSLPFMEKAYTIDPTNKDILTGLSGIYYSLDDSEKLKTIQALLEKYKK